MNPWAIVGVLLAIAAAATSGYVKGRHDEHASHLEQVLDDTNEARRIEHRRASIIQETQDAKAAELRRVSARLADALVELRKRPDRLPDSARAACGGATGAELSGRDADFLVRLAARADTLRTELGACQARERALNATP